VPKQLLFQDFFKKIDQVKKTVVRFPITSSTKELFHSDKSLLTNPKLLFKLRVLPPTQHCLVCEVLLKKQSSVSPSPLPKPPCKYPMFVVTPKTTSTFTTFWHKVLCLCFLPTAGEEMGLCCDRTGQALCAQPSLFCSLPLNVKDCSWLPLTHKYH